MKRRATGIALSLALALAAALPAPRARGGFIVRVTFYQEAGVMADGNWTYPGAAACSYDFPLGTALRFLDSGEVVVCEDRGQLTAPWIDVFAPDGWQSVAPWGPWRPVEVVGP